MLDYGSILLASKPTKAAAHGALYDKLLTLEARKADLEAWRVEPFPPRRPQTWNSLASNA